MINMHRRMISHLNIPIYNKHNNRYIYIKVDSTHIDSQTRQKSMIHNNKNANIQVSSLFEKSGEWENAPIYLIDKLFKMTDTD